MTKNELTVIITAMDGCLKAMHTYLGAHDSKKLSKEEHRHYNLIEEAQFRAFQAKNMCEKAYIEYKLNHETF